MPGRWLTEGMLVGTGTPLAIGSVVLMDIVYSHSRNTRE